MKNLTEEQVWDLSKKIEGLVELELGRRVPFVCLIVDGEHLGIFTNRRSNLDVKNILEAAADITTQYPEGIWKKEKNQ